MAVFATTLRFATAIVLLLLALPVSAQEAIDTGTLETVIYPNGNIGGACDNSEGLTFNGIQGLCAINLLLGLDSETVLGTDYANTAPTDYTPVSIGPATSFPYLALNQGVEVEFAAIDEALDIDLNAYWAPNADFVLLRYEVTNTSDAPRTGIVPGLFVDFDIDINTFGSNVAAFDGDADRMWVFDNATTGYVGGTVYLDTDMEGWECMHPYTTTDAAIYTTMTTPGPESCTVGEDVRSPIGSTAFDLAAGETYTLLYGIVVGEDEPDFVANAEALEAALSATSAIHDTGVVQFEVFDNGKLGSFADTQSSTFGEGFVFDGENGLFEAQVLVGTAADRVSGSVYDFDTPPLEWTTIAPVTVAAPPPDSDVAFSSSYADATAAVPIGLAIEQLSYSASGDPYVVVSFDVTNTTGDAVTGAYIGMYADWDVGTFDQNLADYDSATRLLYVWDESNPARPYYGVVALDDLPISGVTYEALPDDMLTEELLFQGLSTINPAPTAGEEDDMRTILGLGPFDIEAGATQTVSFAFVGGADEEAIIANAAAAQGDPVAAEETTQAGRFVLQSAYPNPFAASTTLGFALPAAEHVRLTVYDLLGRRIATLVDGVRQAGDHTVRFDATGLQSGTYLYRLEAGGAQLTERFTLVR